MCVKWHSMNCDDAQTAEITFELEYAEAFMGSLDCSLDSWCMPEEEGGTVNPYNTTHL